MKIAHLIFFEGIAGAENYLMDLLPELTRHGIEPSLICVCPPNDYVKGQLEIYSNYFSGKGVPVLSFIGKKRNYLSIASKINKYLRSENIRVLHSHLSICDVLAVMVKMFFNRKLFLISSKHGYDENYLVKYSSTEKVKIDRNFYYYVTKFLLSKINKNLAVSKAVADLYYNIKLTKEPFHYIHHGVQPGKHSGHVTHETSRYSPQQLIIAGRLEKMKGHEYLFRAMPEVIKIFPDVKLLVMGRGSEKDNLVAMVRQLSLENNILFLGFQDDPYSFISNSDVIVLPSLFEPFGLVYIESFALKKPVVAFDVQATNEIITNNETGILVPKYSSKALAEKIISLLQHPEDRERLSANAFRRYQEYFTVERMGSETATWYHSLEGEINSRH